MRVRAGLLAIAFAGLVRAALATDPQAMPRFEDLPVDEVFDRTPAPVALATARARQFRTVLREEARRGPNFSGHYRVAIWGCGSDCHAFAIVDSVTGTVYFQSDALFVAGLPGNDEARIQFRQNSRLLVLVGSRNDSGAGRYYYEWTGRRLTLLATAAVAPPPTDPDDSAAR